MEKKMITHDEARKAYLERNAEVLGNYFIQQEKVSKLLELYQEKVHQEYTISYLKKAILFQKKEYTQDFRDTIADIKLLLQVIDSQIKSLEEELK